MGCGASSAAVPPRQLVLLGGGECGKTTIFKQIQILHGTGFNDKAMEWIDAIHASPLRAMKTLMGAVNSKGLKLLPENEARREAILGSLQSSVFNEKTVEVIKALMKDPVVIELLEEDNSGTAVTSLDLDDNAKYFLSILDELAMPGYKPTTDQILKVRDPTRTIETLDFQHGKAKFRVIDVGGQRMERPKWNLTGDVTAVIFVCALTEYNQVLREDVKQNRLKESLNLFDIACNRRYPDKPIILFLNKNDLFMEKIKEVDLKCCFPTYKGGCDYQNALEYIKFKFANVRKDKSKKIYIYETSATDTANMKFIIDSMIDIVEQANLEASGLGG